MINLQTKALDIFFLYLYMTVNRSYITQNHGNKWVAVHYIP